MLSSFAKFLLSLTAMSPMAITWAIADYGRQGYHWRQWLAVGAAVLLGVSCSVLLRLASKTLTKVSFVVQELKAVDNEVVAYIVTYLFPLVAPNTGVSLIAQSFVLLLLAFVLSTSNAFTFNPILSLIGYHFYEAKCISGVSYLLLSKSNITDVKSVRNVGRISKYFVLDLT